MNWDIVLPITLSEESDKIEILGESVVTVKNLADFHDYSSLEE